MTDYYGYFCQNPNCKEPVTKRGRLMIKTSDGRMLCSRCDFEEKYPGREYPY
jgi:hypothetical protein